MDILILMILSSISLGGIFLIIFLISLYSGQFDDYETPRVRILIDDDILYYKNNKEKNESNE
ncbi:cbb3-type cytochrome oxidase assembly protein CcoS [Blattabacterium cuenoti]|uniref:cbb3-type cytochrome oxidase assembly protein CcoS n=1 Tax=Blattabacterium cuenoti TaxID=1653831 RepID=UPI00163D3A9F|nr:cbb3-type cytochrome oxidase assembly protein CcoS [Blattabacterium cuenoti]